MFSIGVVKLSVVGTLVIIVIVVALLPFMLWTFSMVQLEYFFAAAPS